MAAPPWAALRAGLWTQAAAAAWGRLAFLLLAFPSAASPAAPQDVNPDIVIVTRLIPEAHGTTCNERLEDISGTEYARILRVPFRDRTG